MLVANKPEKNYLFSTDERIEIVKQCTSNVVNCSTNKKHQPLCKQAEIVLNLDLAILSTNLSAYKTYVENIRAEYIQHIPGKMFYSGRGKFFKKF